MTKYLDYMDFIHNKAVKCYSYRPGQCGETIIKQGHNECLFQKSVG